MTVTNARQEKSPARRRIEAQQGGKASDFISHIDELKPTERVVIVVRVSGESQYKNLVDQERLIRRSLEAKGVVIVSEVVRYVGSADWAVWISHAVAVAKREDATALVFETVSRAIRHPRYDPKSQPNYQARKTELEDLIRWADGLRIVTVLHPDASSTEEMSAHRRRGQQEKGRRGGRPVKLNRSRIDRKSAYLPMVVEMHQQGLSAREISRRLKARKDRYPGPCPKTVLIWIREWEISNAEE